MRQKRVRKLEQLGTLAYDRKAVVLKSGRFFTKKPLPAAVILNMQGTSILRLLTDGLYVYDKGKGSGE